MDDVENTIRWLTSRLPGWHVWHTGGGKGSTAWSAVAGAAGLKLRDILKLPGRVDAATPRQLIEACAARYGYAAVCATCQRPTRVCGHVPTGAAS